MILDSIGFLKCICIANGNSNRSDFQLLLVIAENCSWKLHAAIGKRKIQYKPNVLNMHVYNGKWVRQYHHCRSAYGAYASHLLN